MFYFFALTLKKDLIIAFRHPSGWLNPLCFFVLVIIIFPLAITSDPNKLMLMGPGIIWICLLFANMLSIEHLFTDDFEDGTLEQMVLQPGSLSLLIIAKLIAHWLITTVPLLLASLLLSQFFFIKIHSTIILFLSLLLGSPVLTLLGAIGSSLTLSLQNRGIILIIMVLPLYLPILIFGAAAANNAALNLPVASQLGFLAAFSSLSLTFMPMAIAAALKISLE